MVNPIEPGGTPTDHVYAARVPSADATRLLMVEIQAFMTAVREAKAAKAGQKDETPETLEDDRCAERGTTPRHVVRGEAGLGKTTVVLSSIKEAIDAGMNGLALVPYTHLADDLARSAEAKGIRAPVVVRGRDRDDPEQPGRKMCWKSDLANKVASLRYSVKTTLCDDGQGNVCPFADRCGSMRVARERREGGTLYIAAHNFLSIPTDLLSESRIDFVVIDETFWQTLVRHSETPIDRFLMPRTPCTEHRSYQPRKGETPDQAAERARKHVIEFGQIQDKTRRAIGRAMSEERGVTLADFRAVNLSPGDCRFAAGVEYTHLRRPAINPAMPIDIQEELVAKAVNREAFAFARAWKLIGRELETKRTGLLMSLRLDIGGLDAAGNLANLIRMDFSIAPRFQRTPVLMIDADADPVIVERCYPGARFAEIAAEWSPAVNIRQVKDRSGSRASLSRDGNVDRIRLMGLDMADRLAERIDTPSKRPLVVAQKRIEDAWREEGHRLEFYGETPDETAAFRVAHFNAIRGLDTWKETVGLIVAGRVEPSPAALDTLARALFFESEHEIANLLPDERGRHTLPRRQVRMTAKDGSTATVAVSYHPDERATRILHQIREAELSQTLARPRPIHRAADAPCEIVVLTNLPLRVQPDSFVRWNALVPDRWREMELRGLVPDLSCDVAEVYPDLFPSEAAVRQAARSRREARKCEEGYMETFYGVPHTFDGMARFSCRRQGNRRGRGGWVRWSPEDDPETVAQRVRDALPGAYDVIVTSPLPDPIERPQAALEAVEDLETLFEEADAAGVVIWWRDPLDDGPDDDRWNDVRPFEIPSGPPDPGDWLRH